MMQENQQTADPGESLQVFTDGACQGRSGRGGWAAVFLEDGKRRIISGSDRRTTGNRMELTAVIRALETAPEGLPLTIHSENKQLVDAVLRGRDAKANRDLWEELAGLRSVRDVRWWWVRSRREHPASEIAGRVANMEAGLFETQDSHHRYRRGSRTTSAQRVSVRGGKPSANGPSPNRNSPSSRTRQSPRTTRRKKP